MGNILKLWNNKVSDTVGIPTVASYYIKTDKEIKDGKSKDVKRFNYITDGSTIKDILKKKIEYLKKAEINAEEKMFENFLKRIEEELSEKIAVTEDMLEQFKTDKGKIDFFNLILTGDSEFYNILVNAMKMLPEDSIENPQYTPEIKEGVDKRQVKQLKSKSKKKKDFPSVLGAAIDEASKDTKKTRKEKIESIRNDISDFNVLPYRETLQRIAVRLGGEKSRFITLWELIGYSDTYLDGQETPGYKGSFKAQYSNKEWGDFKWEKTEITIGNYIFEARVLYKIIQKSQGNIFSRNANSQLFLHDILTSTLPNAIERAYYNTISLMNIEVSNIILSENPQVEWEKFFQKIPDNKTFQAEFENFFEGGLKELIAKYHNEREISNLDNFTNIIIRYLKMGSTNYNKLLKTLFPIYKQKDASMDKALRKNGEAALESVKKIFIKPPNLPTFSSDRNRNTLAGFALEQLTDEVIKQLFAFFQKNPVESVKFGTSIKPKGDIAIYMPELPIEGSSINSKTFLDNYTHQSEELIGKENKVKRDKAIEAFIRRMEEGVNLQPSEEDFFTKAEREWLSKSSGRIFGWTILDKVLTGIGGDLIFISDKLYRPDSISFSSGFTGEKPNLYGLGTTLKIYDRIGDSRLGVKNINNLIGNILSSRNGLSIGIASETTTNFYDLTGTTEVTDADRELIIYSIAGFLFDDFLLQNYRGTRDENAKRPNIVHLFCLNGVYYPFSIFLERLLKAIDKTDNIVASSGFSNVSISLSGLEKDDVILEDKNGNQKANVEKTENLLTELLYKKTEVSFHFLRNLIKELQEIFSDNLSSI